MKHTNKNVKIILISVLISFFLTLITTSFMYIYFTSNHSNVVNTTKIDNTSTQTSDIVSKVKEGIVTVINRTQVNNTPSFSGSSIEEFLEWYNENKDNESKTTIVDSMIGSGFVIKKNANEYTILTNNHVIAGANELDIMFSDKTRVKATVVGAMEKKDVAVLKFTSTKKLPVLEFADSKYIKLGEDVIAIGSPLSTDYQQTVTKGIVSKLPFIQQIDEYDKRNALQTDTAINPGNSGGPLLNLQGHVIGMNTFKRQDAENLSFSMPSNDIKLWANQIMSKNK